MEKIIYNLKQLVKIEVVDKKEIKNIKYQKEKKIFGIKIQKEGFSDGCTIMSRESLEREEDWGHRVLIEDNIVYTNPYVLLRFVDGSTHINYEKTYKQAEKWLNKNVDYNIKKCLIIEKGEYDEAE